MKNLKNKKIILVIIILLKINSYTYLNCLAALVHRYYETDIRLDIRKPENVSPMNSTLRQQKKQPALLTYSKQQSNYMQNIVSRFNISAGSADSAIKKLTSFPETMRTKLSDDYSRKAWMWSTTFGTI